MHIRGVKTCPEITGGRRQAKFTRKAFGGGTEVACLALEGWGCDELPMLVPAVLRFRVLLCKRGDRGEHAGGDWSQAMTVLTMSCFCLAFNCEQPSYEGLLGLLVLDFLPHFDVLVILPHHKARTGAFDFRHISVDDALLSLACGLRTLFILSRTHSSETLVTRSVVLLYSILGRPSDTSVGCRRIRSFRFPSGADDAGANDVDVCSCADDKIPPTDTPARLGAGWRYSPSPISPLSALTTDFILYGCNRIGLKMAYCVLRSYRCFAGETMQRMNSDTSTGCRRMAPAAAAVLSEAVPATF